MSQLSFDHLLNLSFAWHTHRKTGEILRVLDRGAAINHTFEVSLDIIVNCDVDLNSISVDIIQYRSYFRRYHRSVGRLLHSFRMDVGSCHIFRNVCI